MEYEQEIIDLSDKSYVNDIYLQNFNDETVIKSSLLSDAYNLAFKQIKKIVNRKKNDNKNQEYKSNNIIPLLGGRGTGKTSAVISIVDFLEKSDYEDRRKEKFYSKRDDIKPEFICLDRIEADLIHDKESIFETVLITMYNKYEEQCRLFYQNHNKEYLQRDLGIKFNNVLKSFQARRNFGRNGQSELQNLHDASLRINLESGFQDLVSDFLKFLSTSNGTEKFMVISVDDLDMNIKNGFSLMEEIHQYFVSDNIIVFITMDITQFSHICENHFAKLSPVNSTIIEEGKIDSENQYWISYTSKITQNYIDKMFPAENRIYLPGIHNENRIPHLKNFESKYTGESKKLGIQKIKWVILYKIFRRTGIICDGLGKKKHYYEPDTLRKVVSFISYLNQMEPVFKDSFVAVNDYNCSTKLIEGNLEKVGTDIKINMESIYKDIVERMEYEKLRAWRKARFDEIRRQHTTRQCPAAFDYLRKELYNKYKENDGGRIFAYEKITHIDDYYRNCYNYGNFMCMLYIYSFSYEKSMIHMFLALESANLTFLYNKIWIKRLQKKCDKEQKNQIDQIEESVEDIMDSFLQIMGDTISGEWANYFLANIDQAIAPKTEKSIKDDFTSIASVNRKLWSMNDGTRESGNKIIFFEFGIEQNSDYQIKTIVGDLLSIFASLIPGNNLINVEYIEEPERVRISTANVGHVDLFGFVLYYFDIKRNREKLLKRVEFSKFENSRLSSLKDDLEKEWLSNNLKENEYNACALPVYSVDVYYNILKRLYENKSNHFGLLNYKNIVNYKSDDLTGINITINDDNELKNVLMYASAYMKLLERTRHLLKKQDDYYNVIDPTAPEGSRKSKIDIELLNLVDTFDECPFVKHFLIKNRCSNSCNLGTEQEVVRKYLFLAIGKILCDTYIDPFATNSDTNNGISEDNKKI